MNGSTAHIDRRQARGESDDVFSGDIAALLLVAFGVGIVVGLTGMGGGALMTPALIFLGVAPSVAVANDLVAAAVNKSVGATVHWRNGSPDLRLACWLIAGSVPTAFAGAFIIRAVGPQGDQEQWLKYAIGATLICASLAYVMRSYLMLRSMVAGKPANESYIVRPAQTMLLGSAGGLVVGVTSVGSGSVIMVALLIMYPALSAVRLVGTDLVQAIPLVASAALSHVLVSGVDWSVLAPLIIGGSPGTFLGARLANVVSQSAVRRGISIVLFLTGLALLGASPAVMAIGGAALIILGPVAWGFALRRLGFSVD